MSLSAATVLVSVLGIVAAFGFSALRRRVRGDGAVGDVAAAQRNYLASNWHEVEAAARRGGMDDEQIAEVRRKLLGA
jgi:hypothetical protein